MKRGGFAEPRHILPLSDHLAGATLFTVTRRYMAYFPPPPPDHDPDDGRDPLVKKHYKTLQATRVFEDVDGIDSDRVPYDDLQRSPAPYSGHFQSAFDSGTLTICSRPYHSPVPMAVIKIRNRVKSDGTMDTLVSIYPFKEDDNGE